MNLAYLLFLFLLVGLAVPALVVLARAFEAASWRRSLVAYQIQPPQGLSVDNVGAWLATIAATTHPTRFSLLPLPPVVFEVVSDVRGVRYYVLVARSSAAQLLAGVRATMPGCRLTESPEYLEQRPDFAVAAELTMTSHSRQLAVERAESTSTALLASLQPVEGQSELRVQWLLTSAGTPQPVRPAQSEARSAFDWWQGSGQTGTDAVSAARAKYRDPLLFGVARLGVAASSQSHAHALFRRTWNNWHGLNNPGVQLRRRWLPSSVVGARMVERSVPLFRWPLTVSSKEAAGLLALPVDGSALPGVALGAARQLPPPVHVTRYGSSLGVSNYPGMTGQALRISIDDRLRHLHLIGPTGTGKSTLIANLALQDIADGRGVAVVDPKGDLVQEIAARIPAARQRDVVYLSPAADGHVVGFNPLNAGTGQGYARELVADHVLNILHSIYRDFWGPRTDDILRAALFTLTHTKAPDGSAFTMIEVPELLTSLALRRFVTAQQSLPAHLKSYWQQFDAMSEDARMNAIGPVLNKLRAFTMRTPVRLMLGQSDGVRFNGHFFRRGILLVSLAKGALGAESANLLGSLLVSALWQATMSRSQVAEGKRAPFFAYLDEFQNVVRLGAATDLPDMLAQARGLGLGLVLAHQYLNQLPEAVRDAVLGTVRTSVAFQSEYSDASVLAKRFAPLTADDLQGLGTYEIAARLSIGGSTAKPVTGVTLPLGEPTGSADELAVSSRERFGLTVAEVIAGLEARIQVSHTAPTGRRKREARP